MRSTASTRYAVPVGLSVEVSRTPPSLGRWCRTLMAASSVVVVVLRHFEDPAVRRAVAGPIVATRRTMVPSRRGALPAPRAASVDTTRGAPVSPPSKPVLVLNAGSSSLKYQVVASATGGDTVRGHVGRIGPPESSIAHEGPEGDDERAEDVPDHDAALRAM